MFIFTRKWTLSPTRSSVRKWGETDCIGKGPNIITCKTPTQVNDGFFSSYPVENMPINLPSCLKQVIKPNGAYTGYCYFFQKKKKKIGLTTLKTAFLTFKEKRHFFFFFFGVCVSFRYSFFSRSFPP